MVCLTLARTFASGALIAGCCLHAKGAVSAALANGVPAVSRAVVLAERGKLARYSIVLPENPSPAERYAAEELRDFTAKATGVTLPVVLGGHPVPDRAIFLGKSRLFSEDISTLGSDGFRILARPPHLHVLGSPERGVLYGVYGLLERHAGCRWYSARYSRTPKLDRFEVPADLDRTERPAFDMREPHWHDIIKHPEFAARLRVNSRSWCRTEAKYGGDPCRFGGGLYICHTFEKLMPANEFFAAHPEYFSQVSGVRVGQNAQLCLTNPDVLHIVTERVKERIRKDPGARFYGVSQNDNGKVCTCPACRAVDEEEGSQAGTLVRFLNALGESVEREFPDAVIETLAYQYTRHPPRKTRLRHNVVPCLCTIECDFALPIRRSVYRQNKDFLSDIKGWSAQTDSMLIWDYTTDFLHFPLPFANVRSLRDNLRFFRDQGAKYIYEEGDHCGSHADFAELKTWLLAKWMWNPDLPEEVLLDDFFTGYYGAAAPYVRRYFDELHRHQSEWSSHPGNPLLIFSGIENPVLSDRFLAQANVWWRQAAEAVKGDPERAENVRRSAFSVDYVRLMRAERKVRFTEEGLLASAERQRIAKSLVGRMEQAGDIQLSIRGNGNSVQRWREIAMGMGSPAMVAGRMVELEERDLHLAKPGALGEFVKDDKAEDGRALKLFNTHFERCTRFALGDCAFRSGERYTLSIRARVDSRRNGEAFWAEVCDNVEDCCRGGIKPQTKDTPNEYRWYDVLTWVPGRNEYLWIGPGRFGEGASSAVNAVYIDKIAFRSDGIVSFRRDVENANP